MSEKGTETPTTFSEEQIVNWLIDECRDAGNRAGPARVPTR